MYQTDEAKIYYLYMLSDGEASKKEKELFTTICKELYIDADEKKRIIKECEKIPSDGIFDEIKELAGDPVEETESRQTLCRDGRYQRNRGTEQYHYSDKQIHSRY